MSWERVRAWREHLRSVDAATLNTGLSAEGAREAWTVALDALSDEALAAAAPRRGEPYRSATFVAARTVFTAPIEWCAVLLGRGTTLRLKYPAGQGEVAKVLAARAQDVGLPLTASDDRDVVDGELVVAMGSDLTMAALAEGLASHQVLEPHGHRFSVAWVTGEESADAKVPADFRDPWGAVAADLALHEGRGCLSPVAVFTPLPLPEAARALAEGMARAEKRWPVGEIGAGEWGLARSRGALARVTGLCVPAGRGAVHALPVRYFEPAVLPRHVALFQVDAVHALVDVLRPWAPWLSTVGTDDPAAVAALRELGSLRVCGLGRMQRPDLVRIHDGGDWVATTLRA